MRIRRWDGVGPTHPPTTHCPQEVPVVAENQSAKIRRMRVKEGKAMGAIAKKLGIRYQTVWRTLHRKYQGVVPEEAYEAKWGKTEEPLVEATAE